jgi:dTDP-4-amino-4,6-dideoxygalactose transaminase
MKSVPLLDIPASYPQILKEVEQAIGEVIRSGRFILGPQVAELEEKIAAYCGCPFGVGVSSGTDALIVALMAGGVGQGDEVITTPFTFFATAGAIVRVGAKPVFVDIDPETFNIDPKRIGERITPRTKAIIPIHLYGQCADMDGIIPLAKKHGLVLIEDAAQAIGAEYKNRRAGAMSRFGCFSFFPSKNLGGFGDGGLVTVASEEDYEMLKILRVHGSHPKYYHKYIGGNFRLDTLQAAVLLTKLKYLDGWSQKRRNNANTYNRLFGEFRLLDRVQLPREVFPSHVYNQYVIRTGKDRDSLRQFLQTKNIGTEIYYPLSLHMQECFAHLGYKKGDFPVAEKASQETLALPIYPELTLDQQEYVVKSILEFYSPA